VKVYSFVSQREKKRRKHLYIQIGARR